MSYCKYCYSYDLIDTSDDVACRDCGAEQGLQQFVVSYDMIHHVEPIYKKSYSEKKEINDLFIIAQNRLNVPDSVISTAQKLLDDYYLKRGAIKTNKNGHVFASIYYASKDMQVPYSRKKIMEYGLIESDEFTKACVNIKTSFANNSLWARLFTEQKNIEIPLTNQILQYLQLELDQERSVRKNMIKIYEKIKDHHSILSFHPSTLAAALVYIGAKVTKLDIKMTRVSACSKITMASIINVQKAIMQILTKP